MSGSRTGAVGQVELWRNLGPNGFASLDASYATAFDGYNVQGRVGRKLGARLSAGLEGAALGNAEYDSGRGGGFIRLDLGRIELTVSGGVSGDYYDNDLGGYGSISLFGRF